ncbi:MAG: PSD1 and planctomycete cytochrome C domain-containing protein, partial [Phycisphaeraceae bacterium]|nr:PSD1 and planctomycete cytochrome C domain-containing protein [Phycisphaeraceae bacterium]
MFKIHQWPLAVYLTAVAAWVAMAGPAATAAEVDFTRDIRPILSNLCFACHGPDAAKRKGGVRAKGRLRLDTRDGATTDHDGFFAIKPGNPDASELILRITTKYEDERMPPKGKGRKLTPKEIDLLKRWIKAGAPYAKHWSYTRIEKPSPPQTRNASWPRNPIDRFVLAKLEKSKLKPSPEADRITLARRASLDLTGLPPTLEQVDQFVADKSPDAYERYVDRLLASNAYGERWARVWLDLARYADSAGYTDDRPRTIWPYRDWVIKAINKNMPYDQFTIEQIAGDMLPKATRDQKVATAFHRNTLTNNEGGTSDEEFRNVAVVDRVNTTMQVWMGTTFNCAQCHTHKYDPITQEEYFQFFDIFNQTADADKKNEAPVLKLGRGRRAPSVPVMQELPAKKRRKTHIQIRGNFLDKGKRVRAGVPSAFHPLPKGAKPDRLGVAKWIVSRENPLTARVTANRYWEQLFGIGLVSTSEEFGSQGQLPSHPKLLDWMAADLMENGWDIKRLIRQIVTSATYRQSAKMDAAAADRDPDNRLLARGPRFRLSAEMIRDQALFVSGLLSRKMYGP